jgi:hypothetical protein
MKKVCKQATSRPCRRPARAPHSFGQAARAAAEVVLEAARAAARRTGAARQAVQHRGHPPREVLGTPDAAEALARVRPRSSSLPSRSAGRAPRRGRARRIARFRPFAPVRRCAPSPARKRCRAASARRRLRPGHAFQIGLVERPALERRAARELLPDPLVRPAGDVLVGRDLEVAGEVRPAKRSAKPRSWRT